MRRYLFILYLVTTAALCAAQQQILLVGTHHQTATDRINEIIPVAAAVERFAPDIICTEYPLPSDSASLTALGASLIFEDREAKRNAWNIPADGIDGRIRSLQHDPQLLADLAKQTELQQLYHLTANTGNAEYFGFRVMHALESIPSNTTRLRETYPGFMTLKAVYDTKNGSGRTADVNNEYYRLVFPLAIKLNHTYLYPIDDLSTWKKYEKYFDRLHAHSPADVGEVRLQTRQQDFLKSLETLPLDSNQWLHANAVATINALLYVEGYFLDGPENEDTAMLRHYWVLRNQTMAEHIATVAKEHPQKKIVVFFGASHVGAVREELKKLKQGYKILTLPDVLK